MEPARQVACPQCGAPAPFRGAAVSLVCEHCGSTLVRAGLDARLLGRVSAVLDDGSPLLLGARGRFDGRGFEIAGRLQLRYARGTWSEWYLLFADGEGWLADSHGNYAVTTPGPAAAVPHFHDLAIGTWHEVHGLSYMVVDRREARYQGAEGCLPLVAEPGGLFFSADLAGPDDAFLTLDYGSDPHTAEPAVYRGRAVELTELGLDRLRRFEGWRD
jgi:ribosomal protein S27E